MWVRNARDFGLSIKDRRHALGLSQATLAQRVGVSRHWVMDVEAGKKSVELGLVLDTLAALNMTCNLKPRPGSASADPATMAAGSPSPSNLPAVDLEAILARSRASSRD